MVLQTEPAYQKQHMSYNQWTRWLRAYDWREVSLCFGQEIFLVAVRPTKNHSFVIHGLWWNSQFWPDRPVGAIQTFGFIRVDSENNDWLIPSLKPVIRGTIDTTDAVLLQIFKNVYPFKIDRLTLAESQHRQEVKHWVSKMDIKNICQSTSVAVLNVGDTIYMPKGVCLNGQYSVAKDWHNDLTFKALSLAI